MGIKKLIEKIDENSEKIEETTDLTRDEITVIKNRVEDVNVEEICIRAENIVEKLKEDFGSSNYKTILLILEKATDITRVKRYVEWEDIIVDRINRSLSCEVSIEE